MLIFINWLTVIISFIPLFKSVNRIVKMKFAVLHICVVVFFVMQILPLIVDTIFGVDYEIRSFVKMYAAMTDEETGYIYCFFCITVIYILYFAANKIYFKKIKDFNIRDFILNLKLNKYIRLLFYLGMISPLFAVAFSPKPEVYLDFLHFYKDNMAFFNNPGSQSVILYDSSVVHWATSISAIFSMLLYLYNNNDKSVNYFIAFSAFVFTWINQKRTLLTMFLICILAIDIIKGDQEQRKKIVKKGILFAAIIVTYFAFYIIYTGKGSNHSWLWHYAMYYSRMSNVKTSLYSAIYNDPIQTYAGESIIYNLFFYIPRAFWPDKPVMCVKYFTGYAVLGNGNSFLDWNLQINMWTEYIDNFGFWGIIISLSLLIVVCYMIDRSKNTVTYLSGLSFIIIYLCFGFEPITQLFFTLWIVLLIIKDHKNRIEKNVDKKKFPKHASQ